MLGARVLQEDIMSARRPCKGSVGSVALLLTVPLVEVLFSVSFNSGGTSSPLAGCAPDCLVGSSDGMILLLSMRGCSTSCYA